MGLAAQPGHSDPPTPRTKGGMSQWWMPVWVAIPPNLTSADSSQDQSKQGTDPSIPCFNSA